MTQDQWPRVKALFVGALEQPADARSDWVRQQAAGDEMLVEEVDALLRAHDSAEGFLETPLLIDPADLADVEENRIGMTLGPYVIEYRIDRGGQGIVYCARDQRLGRRVALKSLLAAHEADAAVHERLRREARAAAKIAHRGVATVYALEEIDDQLFIASEFIEGATLRELIDRGPLEARRALSIAIDIADALSAVHDAGVIHRDLKPENVLIASNGIVKLVDFGIARMMHVTSSITLPGVTLGTPAYMPPEQLISGDADVRADIYAVGVVLAEMLTGQHPLAAPRRTVPFCASAVVARCMQTDPADRYQTARDLLDALENASQAGSGSHSAPPDGALARASSRWWWQFHQAAASTVYAAMAWPTWLARGLVGGGIGNALFLTALACAILSITLRLHLWFTSRFYPAELSWARSRARRPLLVADTLFAGALIVIGGLIVESRLVLAVLEIGVGIGSAAAFLLVEPATTRAAFGSSGDE